jgi:signal transduction histidine kinase
LHDPGVHPEPIQTDRLVGPGVIGFGAAGLLLIATLIAITGVRRAALDAIDQEVRDNLARLAVAVAATIDTEAHAAMTDPVHESSVTYRALAAPLAKVIRKTDGVRFVYTLRPVGKNLHFVVDGTPIGDADADGVQDHSFLMDLYEDPDPAAWAALREGRVVVTPQPYTDAWGTFLSGFAPMRLADGTVDGVVGVDVSVDEYQARLAAVERAVRLELLPCVVLSVVGGIAAWWVSRRLFRYTAELEQHRAAADRANKHKSVLLANISHELRTPLTAILGFVGIATDRGVGESERLEAIATVRHNADHLLALINDLLDMSKAEAGTITIEPVETDVHELFRTAAAPLRQRAQDKRIGLEISGVETLPRRVVMDPTRTRQILLNLIGNAVKFTERGVVRVTASEAHGVLIVRVEDTGPGMDAEQISRLFQPFSQVGGSTAKRRVGTGLGLAISRHLAGLMGGSITVESEAGRGSVFTAVLPYGAGRADDVAPAVAGEIVSAGPLAGRRVLLAEDGADNRRLLRFILTRAGAEVVEHVDGQAALEAMMAGEGGRVDLVLTDWDMPRLDGAGLVSALRSWGWRGPVVSLTAHATDDQHRACVAAGCDAHLTKPIDWGVLVDTCAGLIEGKRRAA